MAYNIVNNMFKLKINTSLSYEHTEHQHQCQHQASVPAAEAASASAMQVYGDTWVTLGNGGGHQFPSVTIYTMDSI